MNLQKEKHKPRQHRKVPIYITAHGRTGGANPRTRRSFRQSNHCRENWSPSGCYCLCPRRPQSSGYCLWTPYCRCRCCRHHGSPSPEQRQLLENTHAKTTQSFCLHTFERAASSHNFKEKGWRSGISYLQQKRYSHRGKAVCFLDLLSAVFIVDLIFFMEFVDIK